LIRSRRVRLTILGKRETLPTFSKESLVDLVLAQQGQIDRLMTGVTRLSARARELETKLNVPSKTPDNSSLPPSKGQKPDLPKERKKRRHSHPGVAPALAESPDRIIDARLTSLRSTPTTISTCRRSSRSSPGSTAIMGIVRAAAGMLVPIAAAR